MSREQTRRIKLGLATLKPEPNPKPGADFTITLASAQSSHTRHTKCFAQAVGGGWTGPAPWDDAWREPEHRTPYKAAASRGGTQNLARRRSPNTHPNLRPGPTPGPTPLPHQH